MNSRWKRDFEATSVVYCNWNPDEAADYSSEAEIQPWTIWEVLTSSSARGKVLFLVVSTVLSFKMKKKDEETSPC